MKNQAAIREIHKTWNILPNGNSRNFHPSKITAYTVAVTVLIAAEILVKLSCDSHVT